MSLKAVVFSKELEAFFFQFKQIGCSRNAQDYLEGCETCFVRRARDKFLVVGHGL